MPSWRRKWERAHLHYREMTDLAEPVSGTLQQLKIQEEWDAADGLWYYRAWPSVGPDPELAIVLGDFLFDCRSALDHLMAALVPADRRKVSQFPIFGKNPSSHKSLEQNWRKYTLGAHPTAISVLDALQPWRAQATGKNGEVFGTADHNLWLLHEWQNADKHRSLLVTSAGITPFDDVTIDVETNQKLPVLVADNDFAIRPGGVMRCGPRRLLVEARGHVDLVVRDETQPEHPPTEGAVRVRNCVSLCEGLLSFIRTNVMLPLEPYITSDALA